MSRSIPGATVVNMGVTSVLVEEDNPDETMQVALTRRDLALVVFLMTFLVRAFPELAEAHESLMKKLIELSAAQEFLPWEPGEIDLPGGSE